MDRIIIKTETVFLEELVIPHQINKEDISMNGSDKQTAPTAGEHSQQAKAYFLEGYNCAQAVFLAFHEELALDKDTAARMASSFGGGMGRLREVCGAVSGMFLAAGMLYGYSDPKDMDGKKAQYQRVQALAKDFSDKNGSIVCRELLGLDHKKDVPAPSERTAAYYKKRPCPELVADAAGILETMMLAAPADTVQTASADTLQAASGDTAQATSASSQPGTRLPGDSKDN